VSSHWLNLQGLAATSEECFSEITHATSATGVYVPRALLVDDASAFQSTTAATTTTNRDDAVASSGLVWNGRIETLDQGESNAATSKNNNFAQFFSSANLLANNATSRYRASSSQQEQQSVYKSSSSNKRHVDWDDMGDEMNEEEDDPYEMEQRQQKKERDWHALQPKLIQQLDDYWTDVMPTNNHNDDVNKASQVGTMETNLQTPLPSQPVDPPTRSNHGLDHSRSWVEILAPPYHPRSLLSLPREAYETNSDSYLYYTTNSSWLQDDLYERVRILLEDCDSCQGIVVAHSDSWGSGVATLLLQQLQQEVPSANRWVIPVTRESNEQEHEEETVHTRRIQKTRHGMLHGLALAEQVEAADMILPVKCRRPYDEAYLGAALDTATLPFRLSGNKPRIGLNSYYSGTYSGESPFGTCARLSFGELLTSLKPSNKHQLLELDAYVPRNNLQEFDFESRIKAGTSIEHDQRMRSASSRPRQQISGDWLLDTAKGGLVTAYTPGVSDRCMHHHFGLAMALRSHAPKMSISQYLHCLLEGTGVRYKPEQSIATVLDQSIDQLTQGGYAAGTYWKRLYGPSPVLSVFSNSTRSFGHLQATCANMKTCFAPHSRGYYNRDVATGIVPELEDCEQALSVCYDLRDAYRPPEGSGIGVDDEGADFDF
jgi:hypothetical protein